MELNVKIGDKVLYITNYDRRIATVTKVTPTGRIRIDCSPEQFSKHGVEMNSDKWSLNRATICEYNEEIAQRIKEEQYIKIAVNLMHKATADSINFEDAKTIIEILKKYKKN